MTINVGPIKAAVETAFAAFALPMVIRRVVTPGTFDGETGTYVGRVHADRIATGIDSGRERKFVNGAMVVEDQYVIYVLDDGSTPPSMGEMVIMDDTEVAIQAVDEYQLVGAKLAYRVAVDR